MGALINLTIGEVRLSGLEAGGEGHFDKLSVRRGNGKDTYCLIMGRRPNSRVEKCLEVWRCVQMALRWNYILLP